MATAMKVTLLPILFAAIPSAARAEFFSDFYFGAAFTHETTVRIQDETTFPTTIVRQDADIDPSFTFGFRFGYWIDPAPWFGFAFDFSWFQAEGDGVEENDVFPFSTLLFLRIPIFPSPEYPHGRLQPYAGVGPSAVFYDARFDLRPGADLTVSDYNVGLGLDARAGITILFHRNIGFFIEYRFTHYRANLDDDDFELFSFTSIEGAASFSTHHALAGMTFRF